MKALEMKVATITPLVAMVLDVVKGVLQFHLDSMDARFNELTLSTRWCESENDPNRQIIALGMASNGRQYRIALQVSHDLGQEESWKPDRAWVTEIAKDGYYISTHEYCFERYEFLPDGEDGSRFVELPPTLLSVHG